MSLSYSELARRVAKWNADRDCNHYCPELEARMVFEEYLEVMKAGTVVDKLHEAADVLFVHLGSVHKAKVTTGVDLELFDKYCDGISALIEHADIHVHCFMQRYYNRAVLPKVAELNLEILDAVISANELKPTEKVNGKIVKGDKYVSPRAKIEELVKAWECEHGLS